MKIIQIVGLEIEEGILGLGDDNKVYKWNWDIGEWLLFKKPKA